MVDRSIRLRSVHWKIASMVLNQSRKLCQLDVEVEGSLPLFSAIWRIASMVLKRLGRSCQPLNVGVEGSLPLFSVFTQSEYFFCENKRRIKEK